MIFQSTLGSLQCEGSQCPEQESSRRKKRAASLERLNPCSMPIQTGLEMYCNF